MSEPEAALRSLPRGTLLSATAAGDFERRRDEVGARHRQWRATVGLMDVLYDGDAHRAKALAGNLATEARGVLMAWCAVLSASDSASGGREAGGSSSATLPEIRAAMQAFVGDWREAARALADAEAWESPEVIEPATSGRTHESRPELFDEVLDDLLDRAEREAATRLEQVRGAHGAASGTGAAALEPLRRLALLIGRAWQRVFEPYSAN